MNNPIARQIDQAIGDIKSRQELLQQRLGERRKESDELDLAFRLVLPPFEFDPKKPDAHRQCTEVLRRIGKAREQQRNQRTDRMRPVTAHVPAPVPVPVQLSPRSIIARKDTMLVPVADNWLNSPTATTTTIDTREPIITVYSYNPSSHPATWMDNAILNHQALLRDVLGPDVLPDTVQASSETCLQLLATGQSSRPFNIQVNGSILNNEIYCLSYLYLKD